MRFPAIAPASRAQKLDWLTFINGKLIFTYAAPTLADLPLYQDFLQARYTTIGRAEHGLSARRGRCHGVFPEHRSPTVLPPSGQALEDWIEYVAVVLPTAAQCSPFHGSCADSVE